MLRFALRAVPKRGLNFQVDTVSSIVVGRRVFQPCVIIRRRHCGPSRDQPHSLSRPWTECPRAVLPPGQVAPRGKTSKSSSPTADQRSVPHAHPEPHLHHSPPTRQHLDFDHAVIGGGIIGIATARALAHHPSSPSTILLERHPHLGTEMSSRSSEVIHAGIYYGRDTLKACLCIQGRQQLYAFCERAGVAHRKTGKWIVAQNDAQMGALQALSETAHALGVPTRWIGRTEAGQREPEVRARAGVLESPETGIVDSHGLMNALRGVFEDAGSATVAVASCVEGVRRLHGGRGWELVVRDGASGDVASITAATVVNAAGLGATHVHNLMLDAVGDAKAPRLKTHFAKGNYFSYAASRPKVRTLLYPAPQPGAAGMGTHLTLDLAGRIRFGPDTEWVDSPDDLAVRAEERIGPMMDAVRDYLPGVNVGALQPDYAGIRPKLVNGGAVGEGKGFQDFVIRMGQGPKEGWVDLLGMESPGLTSSLAVGEKVRNLLYE